MSKHSEKMVGESLLAMAAEIARLRSKLVATTAERDALLLEFAPERMTKEQLEEWGKNQVPAKDQTDPLHSLYRPRVTITTS